MRNKKQLQTLRKYFFLYNENRVTLSFLNGNMIFYMIAIDGTGETQIQ